MVYRPPMNTYSKQRHGPVAMNQRSRGALGQTPEVPIGAVSSIKVHSSCAARLRFVSDTSCVELEHCTDPTDSFIVNASIGPVTRTSYLRTNWVGNKSIPSWCTWYGNPWCVLHKKRTRHCEGCHPRIGAGSPSKCPRKYLLQIGERPCRDGPKRQGRASIDP